LPLAGEIAIPVTELGFNLRWFSFRVSPRGFSDQADEGLAHPHQECGGNAMVINNAEPNSVSRLICCVAVPV
jgi:hypothetical protein